jgi:hypothetical protein
LWREAGHHACCGTGEFDISQRDKVMARRKDRLPIPEGESCICGSEDRAKSSRSDRGKESEAAG